MSCNFCNCHSRPTPVIDLSQIVLDNHGPWLDTLYLESGMTSAEQRACADRPNGQPRKPLGQSTSLAQACTVQRRVPNPLQPLLSVPAGFTLTHEINLHSRSPILFLPSFYRERDTSDHQNNLVGDLGNFLVHLSQQVSIDSPGAIGRDNSAAHLVGHNDHGSPR